MFLFFVAVYLRAEEIYSLVHIFEYKGLLACDIRGILPYSVFSGIYLR